MSVVAGDLGIMMPNGMAMSDDGELHTSVQDAVDAASSFVWVGPGTFDEAVTISTAGLMLLGSGRGTLIDGGTTGDAVSIEAANVLVANLSVQTTAGQGNNFDGIATGTGADSGVVTFVWFRDSDRDAIRVSNGNGWLISNCIIEGCENNGYRVDTARYSIVGCIFQSGADGVAANLVGNDGIAKGVIVDGSGITGTSDGIRLIGNNTIAIGCRILNVGGRHGINITATDAIAGKNRVSGSSNSGINDSGTNTVLSANRTGAAN